MLCLVIRSVLKDILECNNNAYSNSNVLYMYPQDISTVLLEYAKTTYAMYLLELCNL